MEADVDGAIAYARGRLATELPTTLLYHTLFHTESVVVPAAIALAAAAGIDDWSRALLVVAAWFHDLGYIEQYDANEPIAVRIVREVLPGFGFSPADVDVVDGLICATQLPQSPRTRLEELMVDADMDALGREDFWALQESLRLEQVDRGADPDPAHWVELQIGFLSAHRYFTAEARARNDDAKARHLAELIAWRPDPAGG